MRLSVALSGGGARCAAQLGYLDRLLSLGIEIEALSGSSGGAIVAALLASGRSPREALEILEGVDYSLIKWRLREGIWDLSPMVEELERIGLKEFGLLQKELSVTLTEYESLESRYVKEGELPAALLASSALIPLFAPMPFQGRLYIDGAFSDNLPVTPLRGKGEILALNVNPRKPPFPKTLWGNLKRAAYGLLNSNIACSIPEATYYVEIQETANYGILDRTKLTEIYLLGERAAERDLNRWEKRCGKSS
ncbi:MAG: hypothetical protein GXO19_01125 [Epsilonproteobacteria bacterium]|nr:hypothetical protein [Campylobacterota bacterium]NPA56316.1 hypothetical protein [Campylobacterota bacterium]